MILVVDNYDSFTWNLVHGLALARPGLALGRDLLVLRNDEVSPDDAERLDDGRGPGAIVISPGPCTPQESGASPAIITRFAGRGVFRGVASPFEAMRYHSLVVASGSIPLDADANGDRWEASAWAEDGGGASGRVVMGLRRVWADASRAPLEGVQFHPESFMTPCGAALLANFLVGVPQGSVRAC